MNHDTPSLAHITDIGASNDKTETLSIGFPVPPPVAPKVDYVRRTKVTSLDDLDNEAPTEPFGFEPRGQQF